MKQSLFKALIIIIYIFVACLLLGHVAFAYQLETEEERSEVLCDYVRTANFKYNTLFKPSGVYEIQIEDEGGFLKMNLSMLKSINVKYNYEFTCNRTGNITNTVDIQGILEEIDGWKAAIDGLVTINEGKTPTASNITAEFYYGIDGIDRLIRRMADETKHNATDYLLTITATIQTIDITDVGTVDEITESVLRIEIRYKSVINDLGGTVTIYEQSQNIPGTLLRSYTIAKMDVIALRYATSFVVVAWVVGGALYILGSHIKYNK